MYPIPGRARRRAWPVLYSGRVSFARDLSVSALTAGFVTVLVGFASSAVIVFQAAGAVGATPAQVSSWMLALGVGMGHGRGRLLHGRRPVRGHHRELLHACPGGADRGGRGLALFATIGSGLAAALRDENQREPALVTFLVTASGVTLSGVGSAFWGLVAGVVTLLILRAGSRRG